MPRAVSAADDSAISFYADVGLEDGGDTLSEVRREGPFGGNYDTAAGGGWRLSLGAVIDLQNPSLNGDLIASVGFIGYDDSGSNGTSEFDVTSLELLYRFDMPEGPHRFGVGLVYHLDPTFDFDESGSCSGDPGCIDAELASTEFDDALGLSLRYEYLVLASGGKSGLSLGARYSKVEYESDDFDADASGLGIFVAFFLNPDDF